VDLSSQATLQQRWARTGRCLKMTDGVHVLYQWSPRQGGTTTLIGSRRPGCAAAATSAIANPLDLSKSVHACCRFWLEEDVITFAAITLLKLDWEWYRFRLEEDSRRCICRGICHGRAEFWFWWRCFTT
jgi:hypothetical protein